MPSEIAVLQICSYLNLYIVNCFIQQIYKLLLFCCRLSETCNHVTALLFKVNHAYKLELSNPACTSKQNEWRAPSGAKQELNLRLQEMKFTKPDYSKGKGNKRLVIYTK